MKVILLLVIVTFSTTHFFAQNHTFQLKTVEIISGEFKAIKQNVATFETDYSKSDFKIKWNQIKHVKTRTHYLISLSSGK